MYAFFVLKQFLFIVVCTLPTLLAHYWMSIGVMRIRFRPYALFIHCAAIFIQICLHKLLLPSFSLSGFATIVPLTFILTRWLYSYRKSRWLLISLILVFANLMSEVYIMAILVTWYAVKHNTSLFAISSASEMLNFPKLLFNCLASAVSFCLVRITFDIGRRIQRYLRHQGRRWIYVQLILKLFCQLLLATSGIIIGVSWITHRDPFFFLSISLEAKYLLCSIWGTLFLGCIASNFYQDLKYIFQLQRNDTLEQQQAISRSLLTNLRYFRHNMINMLYGFEGMILSGDMQRMKEYYHDMTIKCALVNNENIAALERVKHPSLSALLLRSINRAREMQLPLNLYISEGLRFGTRPKAVDLCQVLGVLLDNAIEAADGATDRFVTIEIRTLHNTTEIIVKNTYSGDIRQSNLQTGGNSTKEHHTGQGLLSCYSLLEREQRMHLNFFVSQQYVKAQLLLDL